mmetsp:Transcript_14958/g.32571  ORF Transcript_14958/g.32571 Transcript_14958/m.32571 type:complete len:214 (-) Transcript_14958:649-1290(-)
MRSDSHRLLPVVELSASQRQRARLFCWCCTRADPAIRSASMTAPFSCSIRADPANCLALMTALCSSSKKDDPAIRLVSKTRPILGLKYHSQLYDEIPLPATGRLQASAAMLTVLDSSIRLATTVAVGLSVDLDSMAQCSQRYCREKASVPSTGVMQLSKGREDISLGEAGTISERVLVIFRLERSIRVAAAFLACQTEVADAAVMTKSSPWVG